MSKENYLKNDESPSALLSPDPNRKPETMLFKLPIAASLASAALLLSSSVAASNATFSLVGYGEGIDRTEIYFDYCKSLETLYTSHSLHANLVEAYLGNGTRSVELVFNASCKQLFMPFVRTKITKLTSIKSPQQTRTSATHLWTHCR